ncbi:MAG: four helix bundle protein [Anaerolineales bacterium]|nr:four helix bundle protein [Anaerolineales bacterium]
MRYEDWLQELPEAISGDRLWQLNTYRQALFLGDIAQKDAALIAEKRWWSLADQLARSAGSISANIAEGYSRPTPSDRTRFYAYALGSAREARDWYFKARTILGNEVADQRITLLAQVIRQLINLQKHYKRAIQEPSESYTVE